MRSDVVLRGGRTPSCPSGDAVAGRDREARGIQLRGAAVVLKLSRGMGVREGWRGPGLFFCEEQEAG